MAMADTGIGQVSSVQIGAVAPLGPDGVPSGFVKRPVTGLVEARALGLVGDAQADLRVHGGPDKAVYGYALSNYGAWAADFPEHGWRLRAGAFGENLTIDGVAESDLCVGDVHQIGSTLLQVCQPRQPCFKLALRFEDPRLPPAMVMNGRAGWYYRVLTPGALAAGDAVRLFERPNPGFAFTRLVAIVSGHRPSMDELARMATMEGLAGWLQTRARRALDQSIPA